MRVQGLVTLPLPGRPVASRLGHASHAHYWCWAMGNPDPRVTILSMFFIPENGSLLQLRFCGETKTLTTVGLPLVTVLVDAL